MLLLLFLFIVPSAIGVYFLLKPPVEMELQTDFKNVTSFVTHYKGSEEVTSPPTGSTPALRKQTVNE